MDRQALEEMINYMESILCNYYAQLNPDTFVSITNSYGSVNNFLYKRGVNKRLYKGKSFIQEIENNDNRLCEAEGLEAKIVGRMTNKGYLMGPFNYFLNVFEKPFVPKSWGFAIKRTDGHYFTYGLIDNLKAVLGFMGEDALKNMEIPEMGQISLDEAEDYVSKKDPSIFDVEFKGVYKGNAGNFEVDSFSKKTTTSYYVSLKQILLFKNKSIFFPDNARYQSGSAGNILRINVRPEFYNNIELIKHEILSLLAVKYGKVPIEFPKDHRVDNLNHTIINNDEITALTLYEPLETPNPIFKYINGLLFKLYYIDGKTMAETDYEVLNRYWDLILTPELLFKMITFQASYEKRMKETCYLSGAVLSGKLLKKGSSMPFIPPVYEQEPDLLEWKVSVPIPLAETKVLNDMDGIKAQLTFMPARAYKLIRDNNPQSSTFGGYYALNHKPALLKPQTYDKSFYRKK